MRDIFNPPGVKSLSSIFAQSTQLQMLKFVIFGKKNFHSIEASEFYYPFPAAVFCLLKVTCAAKKVSLTSLEQSI